MKKIILATACAIALAATGASAQVNQGQRAQGSAETMNQNSSKEGMAAGRTTGSAAAHNQAAFGGNPDAGGGARGSTQSTANPNASKEIGGGR